MKLKFKLVDVLNYLAIILFGFSVFAIPVFSSSSSLKIITWISVGLMVILMSIYLILSKEINVDLTVISLFMFIFFAFLSSLVNGMKGFNFTPLILPLSTIVIYLYSNNSKKSKTLMITAFSAIFLFAIVFLIKYRHEILNLDFSKRLGNDFGDENDVAVLLGLGYTFSIYYLLNAKKIFCNILMIIPLLLFCFCGLLTGSKIFYLIVVLISFILIFIKFRKGKIWISFIIVGVITALFVFIMTIPIFNTLKQRFLQFFGTLFGYNSYRTDYSTIFRVYMFEDGIEMFLRKPLFGFGVWGFATYGGLNNGWSHNHFSEGLCNFGAVGFALFHIPFVNSVINYFRAKNKKEHLLPFIILTFFFISMISISFFTQKVFAFVIGPVYSSFCHRNVFRLSRFKKTKLEVTYENY